MCGRTSLFVPQSVLEDRFDSEASEPIKPRYNIAPGDDLAVIRNDASDTIDPVTWGFVPHWADDPSIGNRLINARAETLAEKPSFRDAYEKRRCLVLVDGFYEWKETKGRRQPYRVTREDDQPFALAGLWERWSSNGETRTTTTIITTEPNAVVEPVHDRMPAILDEDEERDWLESARNELQKLLEPCEPRGFRAYPVSKAVNDPANDSPELIEEIDVEETDQSGLDEFG